MDIFGNFSRLAGDKKKRKVVRDRESDFQYLDPILEGQAKIEEPQEKKPFSYLKLIVVAIFLLLATKLFFLQVIGASESKNLALGNSVRPRGILSSRGIITDSKGNWLARNKPSFALGVYPSDIPKKGQERQDFYRELSDLSGVAVDDIRKKIEGAGLTSIELCIIKPDLPREEALLLEEETAGMPGVVIDKRAIREYQSQAGLAHILGYTGLISPEELKANPEYLMSEETGKAGLEKSYQEYLRSRPGIEQVEVDSRGKVVRTLADVKSQQPQKGDNLVLNLDLDLQREMVNQLTAAITTIGGDVHAGAAVALDPKTGAVLGLVSVPYYDNNIFEGNVNQAEYQKLLSDPTLPLFNRATGGTYPSGSIIKIVMASAGLQEGVISKDTSIETPPEIAIGEWKFPDWKWHTGVTNVTRALAESNNIFFYSVAGGWDKIRGLGIALVDKYLSLFGFGAKTGIDLPTEAAGLVPSPEWKEKYKNESWYIGDTYHLGIGQGDLLVTPLQMARAVAAIANGGKLLTPQIVKDVTDADGNVVRPFAPQVEREGFISPDNIATVQAGMRQAVLSGSARLMADLPVSSAAKTGTAQFFDNQKTHAWFECYAPYENPQIALVILVEGGGGGYEVAEPIAHNILQYYFSR